MGIWISFYHFLFGYYILHCEEHRRARFLDLFMQKGIAAYPLGECEWKVSSRYKRQLREACAEWRMELELGEIEGLPLLIKRYRSRVGLLAGALAAALLTVLLQSVVWRVEVSGNVNIPNKTIERNLAALGFGEGSYIKRSDLLAVADEYRLIHGDIAHMDIYCTGTVAHVRVIESTSGDSETEKAPASLVAERDAVIHSLDISHGSVTVAPGEVVKAGDLLVSGVVDGAHESVLLHAEGRVYGMLSDDIVVEIPLERTQSRVKERKNIGFKINFFGKSINICGNTGNLPPTYGTIVEEEVAVLPSGKTLPFSIERTVAVLYEEEAEILTEKEAFRLAFASLKAKLAALLEDGYLVSKVTAAEAVGGYCIVKCTATYITDIAKEQPILLP